MDREQIVKSLRHCTNNRSCFSCPVEPPQKGHCYDELMICAADLIEHQAAEMERLNSIETAWAKMCERLEKEIEWKDKVIELAQRAEAEAALKGAMT